MNRHLPQQTYMIHHLLERLAEGAPTYADAALCIWEGDLPNAGYHPILSHH